MCRNIKKVFQRKLKCANGSLHSKEIYNYEEWLKYVEEADILNIG